MSCAFCVDHGLVVANERPDGTEEMGPCPHCEKGRLIEFPDGGKPGPWGSAGYWQGRPTGHLVPTHVSRPLPGKEQRERVTELVHTTLGGTREREKRADVDF